MPPYSVQLPALGCSGVRLQAHSSSCSAPRATSPSKVPRSPADLTMAYSNDAGPQDDVIRIASSLSQINDYRYAHEEKYEAKNTNDSFHSHPVACSNGCSLRPVSNQHSEDPEDRKGQAVFLRLEQ